MFSLLPAAAFAVEAPSRSHEEIESLEQQYLATTNPEQRRQCVDNLKSLGKNVSGEESVALNAAVSAMLPVADSAWEAEELLAIAAAAPEGEQAAAAIPATDSEFLVEARRAAQQATSPSGDVETLADIRIDHLRNDGAKGDALASSYVQQLWRINTERGAKRFSPRSVMYSGMSETLTMVRARVIESNGHELAAKVSPDQPVVRRGSAMYFDARSRTLSFSQLRPGDLVEIEYRLLPAQADTAWSGYYARIDRLHDGFAARLWRRVLIAPSSMKLYAVEHGLSPAVVSTQGEQTTRVWEQHGNGAAIAKATSPEASASGQPYLHVSTIGSMEEFGRWYNSLLEPGLQLDETLRAVADQIMERNLTTEEKVQAVYENVQRRTRYMAFEFGVHSYQPYAVSTVERRGFGDCKDKAALLVALLRAVGVQADFAMVRTRPAGAFADDAYSVEQFDHAMAYVPELNLYLDGTAPGVTPGDLPSNDQGAMAMTVDEQGNATRRTVPFSPMENTRIARELQPHLDSAGSMGSASQAKLEAYAVRGQR